MLLPSGCAHCISQKAQLFISVVRCTQRCKGRPEVRPGLFISTQTSHTRLAHRVQPTRSSVRGTGTRPELEKSIVIEPTHIKRAPHRTGPEGRGPRLSRHVKPDLRYGRGCLSPHMWFSDLKTPLPTSISRHSDWRATTHTSTLPSSAAERSGARPKPLLSGR
jgi:hypothetical protein